MLNCDGITCLRVGECVDVVRHAELCENITCLGDFVPELGMVTHTKL